MNNRQQGPLDHCATSKLVGAYLSCRVDEFGMPLMQVKRPWRTLLQQEYRPELVVTFFIPVLQQLTGDATGLSWEHQPVLNVTVQGET